MKKSKRNLYRGGLAGVPPRKMQLYGIEHKVNGTPWPDVDRMWLYFEHRTKGYRAPVTTDGRQARETFATCRDIPGYTCRMVIFEEVEHLEGEPCPAKTPGAATDEP